MASTFPGTNSWLVGTKHDDQRLASPQFLAMPQIHWSEQAVAMDCRFSVAVIIKRRDRLPVLATVYLI